MAKLKQSKKKVNLKEYLAKIYVDSADSEALTTYINKILTSAKVMGLPVKGPVSLPTLKLKIAQRKSPGGEGSGTFLKLEKRIYRKVLNIYNNRVLEYILQEQIPTNINIELKIAG